MWGCGVGASGIERTYCRAGDRRVSGVTRNVRICSAGVAVTQQSGLGIRDSGLEVESPSPESRVPSPDQDAGRAQAGPSLARVARSLRMTAARGFARERKK